MSTAREIFSASLFELGQAMWDAEDFNECPVVKGFQTWYSYQRSNHPIPHKVYLAYRLLDIMFLWGEFRTDPKVVERELDHCICDVGDYLSEKRQTPPTYAMALLMAFREDDPEMLEAIAKWEASLMPVPILDKDEWAGFFTKKSTTRGLKAAVVEAQEKAREYREMVAVKELNYNNRPSTYDDPHDDYLYDELSRCY